MIHTRVSEDRTDQQILAAEFDAILKTFIDKGFSLGLAMQRTIETAPRKTHIAWLYEQNERTLENGVTRLNENAPQDTDFLSKVTEFEKQGLNKASAVVEAVRKYPNLHRAWLYSQQF